MIPHFSISHATRLWVARGPAGEVLQALSRGPRQGHASREVHHFAVKAHLALGQRDEAWRAGLDADLAMVPFWIRGRVRAFLEQAPEAANPAALDRGVRLRRWAPGSVRLQHRLALLRHRTGAPLAALEELERCLPLAYEDPLVLEDLLRTALNDLPQAPPETTERLRVVLEGTLALLMERHGDPRLGWDRTGPALHRLQSGDPLGALGLIRPVPPPLRDQNHWEVEALALRGLGLLEAARETVESGLRAHPASSRLWMERHQLDLIDGHRDAAREALERAARCLPPAADQPGATWEWHLRRAAFAHFVDNDPVCAWDHLEQRPREAPDDHHPPLRIQVRMTLGDAEGAYAELRPLLERSPEDLDLRLAEADCLAGLEAWDSLAEHLEDLPEAAHQRSDYWHLKGLAAAHRRDLIPAREALERASQLAPGDLRLVLDAGHACMDLADHERAEVHWRQALRIDPQCAEALVQLAETLHLGHDSEGAKRLLRECLLHHPDHPEAQAFLAELDAN